MHCASDGHPSTTVPVPQRAPSLGTPPGPVPPVKTPPPPLFRFLPLGEGLRPRPVPPPPRPMICLSNARDRVGPCFSAPFGLSQCRSPSVCHPTCGYGGGIPRG